MAASTRKPRRVYSEDEKRDVLRTSRERGVVYAAERHGISANTINDRRAAAKAWAYSRAFQPKTEDERRLVLEQLTHEQEIEMRWDGRRRYRHDRERTGGKSLDEDVGLPGSHYTRMDWVALPGGSYVAIAQRHQIPWLDPVFDEVAAA